MSGTWVGRLPAENGRGLEVLVIVDDAGRASLATRDPEDWNPVWGPPRPLEQRSWRPPPDGPSW